MTSPAPSLAPLPSTTTPSLAPAPTSTGPSSLSTTSIPYAIPTPILTQKTWTIPPRPKPGRKPAVDIPPTKRKAQNRAAQRAFRERRAARVGELEDELRKTEGELREEIVRLQQENRAWERRCRGLEGRLDLERRARMDVEVEMRRLRGTIPMGEPDRLAWSSTVSTGSHTNEKLPEDNQDNLKTPQILSEPSKRPHSPPSRSPLGLLSNSIKRPRLPPSPSSLETDFTSLYSKPQSAVQAQAPSPTSDHNQDSPVTDLPPPEDRCGFCNESTICICAEMEREASTTQHDNDGDDDRTTDPTIGRKDVYSTDLTAMTPPASETSISVKESNPCAGGPGTCAQCRADPQSTLFCMSLAATRGVNSTSRDATSDDNPPVANEGSGCCRPNGEVQGGCCRTTRSSTLARRASNQKSSPLNAAPSTNSTTPAKETPNEQPTLTCAQTYTTLSRHPFYPQASTDLGSWLGKLKTSTAPSTSSIAAKDTITDRGNLQDGKILGRRGDISLETETEANGPTAMDVEAASVMGVLRFFDRRFGREG
ncbi:MAG: hypothetical protein M1817_000513 [Caeruleum heppii]|nr:MAG: hypothetical protein M1817_000513 [Caeruleum heppii]